MRRTVLVVLAMLALATLWVMRPPTRTDRTTAQRTPLPVAPSAPIVRASDPVLGPPDAAHTIVEYADFACPACAQLAPILTELRETYGDALRIVWKDFPHLDRIASSTRLHIAARCAHEQGRFWAYHDALFATPLPSDAALEALAASLGIDHVVFAQCRANARARTIVDAGMRDAQRLGIDGTPTLFVDGVLLTDPPTFHAIATLLDAAT